MAWEFIWTFNSYICSSKKTKHIQDQTPGHISAHFLAWPLYSKLLKCSRGHPFIQSHQFMLIHSTGQNRTNYTITVLMHNPTTLHYISPMPLSSSPCSWPSRSLLGPGTQGQETSSPPSLISWTSSPTPWSVLLGHLHIKRSFQGGRSLPDFREPSLFEFSHLRMALDHRERNSLALYLLD